MQENIQQQLYPDDPLTQALKCNPELGAAVRNIDMRALSIIGNVFQMDMHGTLLATNYADKDAIENIMGLCQGGNAFISWIMSARDRLDELDRERVDVMESRTEPDDE